MVKKMSDEVEQHASPWKLLVAPERDMDVLVGLTLWAICTVSCLLVCACSIIAYGVLGAPGVVSLAGLTSAIIVIVCRAIG